MKKNLKLLILPGDGIGPEVMVQAMRVFDAVKKRSSFQFEIEHGLIGGAAFDQYGEHFPEVTRRACLESDLVLFGAVGGPVSDQLNPKWKNCEVNSILALRKLLDLYANVRPVKIDQALLLSSPLRLEKYLPKVPDLVVVRELSGDIYFGDKGRRDGGETAFDECTYSKFQIERIAKFAFELSGLRGRKLHSIDKANVLETSKLWRETVNSIALGYPDIRAETMLVDNCAMQLISNPTIFDVILTSNMFGDILSDAAAVIPGSLGLLASASFGSQGKWLFEPPSGSAPDIAGKNVANPIGMIRCVGMMFQMALKELEIYQAIENGISDVLSQGIITADISFNKASPVSTLEFTDRLLSSLK